MVYFWARLGDNAESSSPAPAAETFQQTEQFQDSGIVTALDVIGMLSLIGGIVLTLALFASEYWVIALLA